MLQRVMSDFQYYEIHIDTAKHAAMECAMCDTELVAEADSFQFDSLTDRKSVV